MRKEIKQRAHLSLSLGLTAAAMSAFFLGPGAASTSASDSGSWGGGGITCFIEGAGYKCSASHYMDYCLRECRQIGCELDKECDGCVEP
jgi:hypothetical protein